MSSAFCGDTRFVFRAACDRDLLNRASGQIESVDARPFAIVEMRSASGNFYAPIRLGNSKQPTYYFDFGPGASLANATISTFLGRPGPRLTGSASANVSTGSAIAMGFSTRKGGA